MSIKAVGIVAKDSSEHATRIAGEVADWFQARDVAVVLDQLIADTRPTLKALPITQLCAAADVVVVIGGDGTLLRVCRHIVEESPAILGVNAGSLGFLTEVPIDEVFDMLPLLLDGKLPFKDRVKLSSQIFRDGKVVANHVALNDAVINKGALSRMVELDIAIDDVAVTRLKADGVVISTPTGSTAYSLAAGGPILYPSLNSLVITPICPNTLTSRPIVVPDDVTIKITLFSTESEVIQTMDGQVGFHVQHGDRIEISRAVHPLRLYGSPQRDYFSVLRNKLRWGEPLLPGKSGEVKGS